MQDKLLGIRFETHAAFSVPSKIGIADRLYLRKDSLELRSHNGLMLLPMYSVVYGYDAHAEHAVRKPDFDSAPHRKVTIVHGGRTSVLKYDSAYTVGTDIGPPSFGIIPHKASRRQMGDENSPYMAIQPYYAKVLNLKPH